MATATIRMRFWSLVRPAFLALPLRAERRAPAQSTCYHLVISERMDWHPALGWRPTAEYHWLPLGLDGCA